MAEPPVASATTASTISQNTNCTSRAMGGGVRRRRAAGRRGNDGRANVLIAGVEPPVGGVEPAFGSGVVRSAGAGTDGNATGLAGATGCDHGAVRVTIGGASTG